MTSVAALAVLAMLSVAQAVRAQQETSPPPFLFLAGGSQSTQLCYQ